MKKVSKTLAIVLCLVMILSLTALANWTEFGKTSAHNHVVTSSPITSHTVKQIALKNAGGGWDGVDTEPLMRTVGTGDDAVTYAYILYDGRGDSGRLVKINCSETNPVIVWDVQISGSNGFQLSNPLLVPGTVDSETNDAIYLAASNAAKNSGVSIANDISIASGSSATVTCSGLTLATTTNRVAIGVLLGEYSTQQTSFSAHGSASLSLTGGTTTSITLNPDAATSSTNYHVVEEVVQDTVNNTVTYQYWWYINQNISGTTGSGKTLTATINLTDHAGTIKSAQMFGQSGAIQKVTNLGATSADDVVVTTIKSGITGQINTPITTDGTYLYFGTYTGYNTAGTYYQITKTGSLQGSFTTSNDGNYGFYWAGAATDGTRVYFGRDNGKVFWRSVSDFTNTGDCIDLSDTVSSPGNVRSTIMIDGGKLYFTSQGGYLWCCSYNTDLDNLVVDWYTALRNSTNTANVTSTSTPTKVGNRIYVGCYGGTGKSGVKCIDATTHSETYVIQSNSLPVQCSIVVNGSGTGTDYLYFVTNYASGTGYCYSWDGTTATLVWSGTGTGIDQTYALGGMSIENGISVYGNDHNYVSVVK
jgi:FOG: WD40-like repeat